MRSPVRPWLLVSLLAVACSADPLPQPPLVAVDELRVFDVEGGTRVLGLPMALTTREPMLLGDVRVSTAATTAAGAIAPDGSFSVEMRGAGRGDLYLLEYVGPDADTLLVAFTGAAAGAVLRADAGPDRDGDGSPDLIDCAPDEGATRGMECACVPSAERCNGLDDDCDGTPDEMCVIDEVCGNAIDDDMDGLVDESCEAFDLCGNGLDDDGDGFIDEDCPACASDADCAPAQSCIDGACVPR